MIDIELKDRNQTKEFIHKIHNRLEDIMFSIIQKLQEKFIPRWIMDRLEKYLDKRISQLQQKSIKMTWRNTYLQKSLTEIHNKLQDAKEAPSDD